MAATIKKVLVSHAEPNAEDSPYDTLAKEWGLSITFRNFVEIQGIKTSEFRKQNINPLDYSAIIFTGKYPVDHFFRICKDLRIEMPPDMKYFCVNDATAKYLQKYITIRKRKLYVGELNMNDLMGLLQKKSKEKFLYPCGDLPRADLLEFMDSKNLNYDVGKVYQTVNCDLSDLDPSNFGIICFFSPNSIDALFANFPKFDISSTVIAVFGKMTTEAAQEAGLQPSIIAPQEGIPSMTMALQGYFQSRKKASS